jgi:hypothetical protein
MVDQSNPLTSWLNRRRRRKPHNPNLNRNTRKRRSGPLPRILRFQRAQGSGKPRWVVALIGSLGVILIASVALLGKHAFSTPPSPTTLIEDRRPVQKAECVKLVKLKLLYPASYKMVSDFTETRDDGAQRTFEWTFSSRDTNGGTGMLTAVCKTTNHLRMTSIEFRQVK